MESALRPTASIPPPCPAAIARVASHPSPLRLGCGLRTCQGSAARECGKGSAARGMRQGERGKGSACTVLVATRHQVLDVSLGGYDVHEPARLSDDLVHHGEHLDAVEIARLRQSGARGARGEGAGAVAWPVRRRRGQRGRHGRRGRCGRRDGTSKALLVLPPLPPLPARDGRRRRGGGERESHFVLVVLHEYVVERLFLANIRIEPLNGLLRRHPRDASIFAPFELQRVALHRRRSLYEHIEELVVGRVFGVQDEQELSQLIAIELAVLIQVKLLEPAAQARAAARVAHTLSHAARVAKALASQRRHF